MTTTKRVEADVLTGSMMLMMTANSSNAIERMTIRIVFATESITIFSVEQSVDALSVHVAIHQILSEKSPSIHLSVDYIDLDTPISNAISTPTATHVLSTSHSFIDQDPFGSMLDSEGHDDGEPTMIEMVDGAQQLISKCTTIGMLHLLHSVAETRVTQC